MITFTNTTNILSVIDAEKSTTVWSVPYVADSPITIRSFVEKYLDPKVGRCAAINGSSNWVLQKNGDWDRPLNDNDIVTLVPAVGIAWWVPYVVALIVGVVVSLIMMNMIKTDTGTGAASVYSLSAMTNEIRFGKPIERQYGYQKRFPAYASKPYTRFINNEQWVYMTFCLGHGRFQPDSEDPYGIEDTPLSGYDGISYKYCEPNTSNDLFENNVISSAEVSGGVELYAPNQYRVEDENWDRGNDGKYFGWFTANDVGTVATQLYIDIEWKTGLFAKDKKARWKQDHPSCIEIQYRTMTKGESGIVYGEPSTLIKTKNQLKSTTPQRVTHIINVEPAAYQVRIRRLDYIDKFEINDGSGYSETTWSALRAVLPAVDNYGNVTTIMVKAKASSGLTEAGSKRFYFKGTAYSPVYNTSTETWTDTPNRNPIWAMCDVMRGVYGGNYSDSYLDLEHLAEWATWCDANNVYFDYCFDEASDIWEQLALIGRTFRASPIAPLNKLRIIRDEPKTIPTAVFTKENIVDGTFQIQYQGVTDDDHDGCDVEYTDNETFDTATVLCLRSQDDGSNPKTINLPGITDRTRAYRQGMYEWVQQVEPATVVTFETTLTGWLVLPGDMVYVNYPMFFKHASGHIESIDGNIVELDCNVKLNPEYDNTLVVKSQTTGAVLSSHIVTYYDSEHGNYHTLQTSTPIDSTGMVFSDPQALPVFMLGIGSAFAEKVRITEIQASENGAAISGFIDTDRRFDYDGSYPDVGRPNEPPAVIPTAPTEVTVVHTDTNSDEVPDAVTISWTGVEGFDTYAVQYSLDSGENWVGVTGGTQLTSATITPYVSGNMIAKVCVVYGGMFWVWGYSEETRLPTNLTEYVHVSSDNFIEVSSDGYVSVYTGD